MHELWAGAAAADISPLDSQFLYGYPHVERYSTGIHDPLFSSALYLSDGQHEVMFVANDIIFVCKTAAGRVRAQIAAATGVPAAQIMVTATHTHSGPITVDYASSEADPIVPRADPAYLAHMEGQIVRAAQGAWRSARPAELGLRVADATGVGTNRRDPSGPADPEVPVLVVRERGGGPPIACMLVYSMHPTVLHEDSTLVSGDFPAMARQYLQEHVLGAACPVLYHTGPAGNQSTRHVVKGQTFDEARRLGEMLGRAVEEAMTQISYTEDIALWSDRREIDLPRRTFPPVAEAERKLQAAAARLTHLQQSGAARARTRTAEVDWFGAEETLTLARAAEEGRIEAHYAGCLPAEVQVIRVDGWSFVGWPGEVFVEYALALKARAQDAYVISLANGELQGYIVTPEAAAEGGYEASNGLFDPRAGQLLVDTALDLLGHTRT
ncbi:MAG: neutral/alkaline non-lysosomal ceramidase N-terminal domain-containing protein [Anaerolineae bacterium]|nr:neutral/alkaline non-lysosomal ceramidase N-terminal domain-containing protein [Anaerolineae bacterium]